MKHSIFLILVAAFFLGSCNKWAQDKQNIYKYVAPPPPDSISSTTPLCDSIKGTMLAGNLATIPLPTPKLTVPACRSTTAVRMPTLKRARPSGGT